MYHLPKDQLCYLCMVHYLPHGEQVLRSETYSLRLLNYYNCRMLHMIFSLHKFTSVEKMMIELLYRPLSFNAWIVAPTAESIAVTIAETRIAFW